MLNGSIVTISQRLFISTAPKYLDTMEKQRAVTGEILNMSGIVGSILAGIFVAYKFEQIMLSVIVRFVILVLQIIDNHSTANIFKY